MPNEEVQKALQVLREHAINRGDSFDIGGEDEKYEESSLSSPEVIKILNNPQMLAESLNLTTYQAENLRSLIIGGGTGGIHKLLNRHLGDEPSAVIGALISSWLARKVIQ